MRGFAAMFMASLILGAALPAQAAERHTLVIGSGDVTGYYYPVAGAICRVVNKERPNGMTCAVAPSSGSAANLQALKDGDVDMVMLQSRAAQLAAAGKESFKDGGPMPELRALMALHGEAVVVLARQGANIHQLADIKGKRVNLGRPGSFQRLMADTLLEAAGISEGDLSPLVELDLGEQGPELCEGNIDVAIFTGVHPMPEVAEAIEECGARLVPVKARNLDAFVKRNPWIGQVAVKAETYAGVKEDMPSFGPKAILATTTRVSADEVLGVLKAIHANWGAFLRLHPALKGLSKNGLAKDGVPIKLHDGAERFYQEAGIR